MAHLTRWDRAMPPGVAETRALLKIEGAQRLREWANAPGDTYQAHAHSFKKILYCVDGGIVFHIEDGDLELGPGDRLIIDRRETHSATVGPDGVRCIEGELP